ncbi:MAG TPA: PAS domain S-box protein [Burkholderiaceae bacterium]
MDDPSRWLAAVVEYSDDAIITKTLQGVITSWNPAAERLFGYAAAEAVGRPVAMLVPADRADEEPRILARIANGERVDHFETERVRKDGSIVAVSVTISPVRDAGGTIVGASKIARDIGERRKADARVQAQLARLFTLDQITRAIGEHQDQRSIYQVALRAVEERLPLDFACICRVDEEGRQLVIAQVGLRSGRVGAELALSERAILPLEAEAWERWTDGSLVYVRDLHGLEASPVRRLARGGFGSLVVAPLKVEGRVASLMIAARREADAFSSTDCEFLLQLATHVALAAWHAQLHESLQRACEDLKAGREAAVRQQRLQALGEMAGGIVHDIGNLVLPAAFFAQELMERETALSPDGSRGLELIKRCLDDVTAIVERLREFHRARDVAPRVEAIDCNEVVRQVAALVRPRCAERRAQGVEVDVAVPACGPAAPIVGSPSEIREALVNLVLNALDAMPGGGTATIMTRNRAADAVAGRPAAVEVVVQDTGVGMDEETRRRCMDPFFTTKGEAGTGMGLAMVYGAVQRHGADITIDSAPGRGTTVTIAFACAGPAPGEAATRSDARGAQADDGPVAPVSRAMRLLLVDDDPLVLETLQLMLQAGGHAITAVVGGRAGIEAFRDALGRGTPFDVVVTDLGMPEVDGWAVARAVKRLASATPVVLLTGWGEGLQRNASAGRHVDAVLGKPPRRGDLDEALAHVARPRESVS